ncbi:hypothetical protein [Nitrospirillum viridazoti]|uniref:Uncharacterized protein n=2 Tax=Nitrospirillum TaxID=1543705 RepID=A0A560IGE2_9PROT|nr:hypothetical protein [Nitrospirillum amazonense]TWB56134.1 hypothetical protein FBZ92_113128 [Nitrospirillum amazonense]
MIRRRAVTGLLRFLLTGLLCFALKMAFVIGVWGWGELKPFTDELAVRMGHSVDLSAPEQAMLAPYGITSEMLSHSRVLAAAYAFAKVAYMMPMMAWGARGVGILALGTSVMMATIALAIRGRRLDPARRTLRLLLLGAFLVVPVWYVVFAEQIIRHAFFMVRIIAWTMAAGGLAAPAVRRLGHSGQLPLL